VAELPSGTVTFLFCDVAGPTRLWEEHPDAMQRVLARHDELVGEAIDSGRHSCACHRIYLERAVAVRLAGRLITARVSAWL
jgi:hypothetical protein